MAGVRARYEFTSEINQIDWRCDIYDQSYGGATFTVTGDGFKIAYDGEGDRIGEPVKTSHCDLMLFDDQGGNFANLITDLGNAAENQFQLIIYKYVSGSYVIHWAGIVLPDLIEWDNDIYPRPFQITASDGLARIKSIPFDKIKASPYILDQQTILKVIFDCLSYANIASFWNGSTKAYITVSADWYDTQQTLTNVTRILENVRLDGSLLLRRDSSDNTAFLDTAMDTGEVLSQLLILMGCRIIHSNGSFHIQQISNFTATTQKESYYNYLGVYVSSATGVSNTKAVGADLDVLAGGKYSLLPALKRVTVKAVASPYILSLPSSAGRLINSNNLTYSGTIKLGTIRGGAASGRQLIFNLVGQQHTVGQFMGNLYLRILLKFKADTYRVKTLLATPNLVEWTTTAADQAERRVTSQSDPDGFIVTIQTPEIPFSEISGCTLDYTISMERINTAEAMPAANEAAWKIADLAVALLENGDISSREIYHVDNPTSVYNSVEVDLGDLYIVDTGIVTSKNTLEVQTTETSGTWVQSGVWAAGFGANTTLAQTLVLETMSLQRTPLKAYRGTFSGIYEPCFSLGYDSVYYVFMGGEYDAKIDQWSVKLFSITQNKTSVEISEVIQIPGSYKDLRPTFPAPQVNNFTKLPFVKWLGTQQPVKTKGQYDPSGGAMTSISIEASPKGFYKSGDTLQLLHPANFEILDAVVLSGDVTETDTTLSITSQTPAQPWPAQITVLPYGQDLVTSDEFRAEKYFIQNFAFPGSPTDTTGKNGDFGFNGQFLYWKDAGTWFRFEGAEVWTS